MILLASCGDSRVTACSQSRSAFWQPRFCIVKTFLLHDFLLACRIAMPGVKCTGHAVDISQPRCSARFSAVSSRQRVIEGRQSNHHSSTAYSIACSKRCTALVNCFCCQALGMHNQDWTAVTLALNHLSISQGAIALLSYVSPCLFFLWLGTVDGKSMHMSVFRGTFEKSYNPLRTAEEGARSRSRLSVWAGLVEVYRFGPNLSRAWPACPKFNDRNMLANNFLDKPRSKMARYCEVQHYAVLCCRVMRSGSKSSALPLAACTPHGSEQPSIRILLKVLKQGMLVSYKPMCQAGDVPDPPLRLAWARPARWPRPARGKHSGAPQSLVRLRTQTSSLLGPS